MKFLKGTMDDVIVLSIKRGIGNEGSGMSQQSPMTTTLTTTNCDDTSAGLDVTNNINMNNSNTHSKAKNIVKNAEGSCLGDETMSQYCYVDNTSCLKGVQQSSTAVICDRGDENSCDEVGGGVDNLSFDPSPESREEIQNSNQHSDHTETDKEGKVSLSTSVGGGGSGFGKAGEVDNDVTTSGHVTDGVPCGLGVCQPQCLQRFRSMGCFSLLFGLSGILTQALTTYLSSQVTTLEKHFNFNSSMSGFLLACNDIGYFLTCLIFSHITRRIHIPRCLALATVVYGISGLMCTIPYFGTKDFLKATHNTYGNISVENSPGQMCIRDLANNNSSACDDASKESMSGGGIHGVSEKWRNLAITIIGIGMVIQGIAKSPRSSFVTVYIDDNVPKTKTSLYLGIISGMSVFGPSVAFILGGLYSSVYITLEDTDMSDTDPRWLGAWWMGFLVFGSVSLLVGLPLVFFPRKLITKPEIELVEMNRKMKGNGKNKMLVELKDMFIGIIELILNPVYVLLVVAGGLTAMSLSGYVAFAPKYLEEHFSMPTSIVNIVTGAVTICGAAIGSMLGGVVTSKYRLSPIACIKVNFIIYLFVCCIHIGTFFLKCDQPVIALGNDGSAGNVSQCTSSCGCNDISFYPVCGDDNKNYFSPCHAGCTDVIDGGKTFSNCSCLSSSQFSKARGGLCDGGCSSMFWIYCTLSFFSSLSLFTAVLPAIIAVTRSVSEEQKPMALGFSTFMSTLIGFFPGPIIFGMIVDSTCLITQSSPCGQEINNNDGACLLYDIADFRIQFNGAHTAIRVASTILTLSAYLYVKCSSTFVFAPHEDVNGDDKTQDNTTVYGSGDSWVDDNKKKNTQI